ncbi:hypothetical protein PYW07_006629 [Mythimna separata]|uniref:Uncharacterized protein n=1 Tax=Mythimna separata TaxID=271217 RepID=A0AAD7YVP5_MYTSE|nr:hypothetical protein PYW07_006629 [Mythimna separata]
MLISVSSRIPDFWTDQPSHLPSTVRTVLAATAITDPEKLAAVADKIQETSRPSVVASVSGGGADSLAELVSKLSVEVAELRKSRGFERVGRQQSRVDRAPSGSRGRSSSRKRSRSRQPGLFFYYNRFGVKAV